MDLAELNDLIDVVRNLSETIQDVRGRIESSGSTYAGNESRTRYGLIDPVLEKLGWDVRDPDLVLTEHGMSGGGKADYALMLAGNPVAVVEAKSLGRGLDADVTAQTLNYIANEQTIKYAIATNGDAWRMQVKGERALTFDIRVTNSPEYECALVLLHISRSMFESVPPSSELQSLRQSQSSGYQTSHQTPVIESRNAPRSRLVQADSASQASPLRGWVPLTGLYGINRHSPKPSLIRFTDGHSQRFRLWIDILRETAKWLSATDRLGSANATVPSPNNRQRYALHTEPIHPTRMPFRKPENVGEDVWIEKDITAQTSIDTANLLLNHCGVDPNSVSIKF